MVVCPRSRLRPRRGGRRQSVPPGGLAPCARPGTPSVRWSSMKPRMRRAGLRSGCMRSSASRSSSTCAAQTTRVARCCARELIGASGSQVYDMLSLVMEAKLELRLQRDADVALALVDRLERRPAARRYGFVAEQIDMWAGYAHLLQGEAAAALGRLRDAVARMLASDRILELPTAAVHLAEAEWRCGDDVVGRSARQRGSARVTRSTSPSKRARCTSSTHPRAKRSTTTPQIESPCRRPPGRTRR